MTARPIAALCLWILFTSTVAAAQQPGDTAEPSATGGTTVNLTFPAGGFIPLRRVERTTASGGRKIIIETTEAPGVEGAWQPVEEVVTETTRGPAKGGLRDTSIARTQRDVFRFDFDRRRRLAESTQSELETQPNADTRNVQRTWIADLDGRLTLSSGNIEETRVISPGIQQKDATLLLQSPEGSLREVERASSTEQQVSSAVVRSDSTRSVRDLNGRWVPTETRSGQTRGVGSAERVEEETIQRQNLVGTLVLGDKVVTRTSESNGDSRVVIETYAQDAEGFVRADSHLALRQRVRRSTTVSADGSRSTIEEIDARNPVAPNDPMRMIRRTVVTVRSVGPGRSVTERRIFERDVNGRLILVAEDTGESTDK